MINIIVPLRRVLLAASLLFGPAAPSFAVDPGDPEGGLRLARAWCSNCHVVENGGIAASTGAPPFAAIAANRTLTPLGLRVFFQSPHVRMPDLHLSNDEMDNLIAYLMSLRGL